MKSRKKRSLSKKSAAAFGPILLAGILAGLLGGCASGVNEAKSGADRNSADIDPTVSFEKKVATEPLPVPRALTIGKNTTNKDRTECKGNYDYGDALMLDDILYVYFGTVDERDLPLPQGSQGERIAKVRYTMSDDACGDFVMQSGDATILATGTPIYAMNGYDADFRVIAEGRIFQVAENPRAKTIGDLYDIEGKVQRLARVSGRDGSEMRTYSAADTEAFVSDLLKLEYVGFDAIFKNNPPEYRTSLKLILQDGTSIELGYWPKANALTIGAYGTDRMQDIVEKEH